MLDRNRKKRRREERKEEVRQELTEQREGGRMVTSIPHSSASCTVGTIFLSTFAMILMGFSLKISVYE